MSVHTEDFVIDDGGRSKAGYKGSAGDCVTRAIAIASELPYQTVYDALNEASKPTRQTGSKRKTGSRTGIFRKHYEPYLLSLGWQWTPTMRIGAGCTIHLRADELPAGRVIASVSKHMVAVIDGVIHDTDQTVSRAGERCVYGYYHKP